MVARYGARIRYWSIWNEPDSRDEPANVCFWRRSDEEFFTGVAAKVFEVIPASSGLQLCMPDLAKAGNSGWIYESLTRFGSRIHALTIHSYSGTGDGSDVLERARTARSLVESHNATYGTQIQLWITETGWSNQQHSEDTVANKIQDLCSEVRRAPWLKKVFPYVWHDTLEDPYNFKAASRGTRRSWAAYKTAINAPQPEVAMERESILVSHTIPSTMGVGRSYPVTVTFRNTGRWPWPQGGSIRVGFGARLTSFGIPYGYNIDVGYPQLRETLEGGVKAGFSVPPSIPLYTTVPGVPTAGEIKVSFTISTPTQPGFYLIACCMVDQNPADPMWFGHGWLQKMYVQ